MMEALGINLTYLIIQLLIFGALATLFIRVLWWVAKYISKELIEPARKNTGEDRDHSKR